jgi:hypothetical protein
MTSATTGDTGTEDTSASGGTKISDTITGGTVTARVKGKDTLIENTMALLLDAHLNPTSTADGEKITQRDRGIREGRIITYLEVLREFPGAPDYSKVEPDTLRAMLLGQALTAHVGG